MNFLNSLFAAIGSVFGWATTRSVEKNSAPMIAAAAANQEQAEKDKLTLAIQTKNTKEIEREIAE